MSKVIQVTLYMTAFTFMVMWLVQSGSLEAGSVLFFSIATIIPNVEERRIM